MVIDHLTDRLGSEPILSVKQSISISTIINFDVDGHGHGDGNGMCKQTLIVSLYSGSNMYNNYAKRGKIVTCTYNNTEKDHNKL